MARYMATLLFLLLWISASVGQTPRYFYASPTGSHSATCASIQTSSRSAPPASRGTIGRAAQCATQAGDIVNITAGTYTGVNNRISTSSLNNTVGTGQLASGTPSLRTIVEGDPTGARPTINAAPGEMIWLSNNPGTTRNYITFRNFKLDGTGVDSSLAMCNLSGFHIIYEDIEMMGGNNMTGCFVSGSYTGSANTERPGIMEFYTLRRLLVRCQHSGGDGHGYMAYVSADNTTIEDSEVVCSNGGAAQFWNDEATADPNPPYNVDNGIFRRNKIRGVIPSTQGASSGQCFGIAFKGTGMRIHDNTVDMLACGASHSTAYGFWFAASSGVGSYEVYNNTIINAARPIQYSGGMTGPIVVRNNILLPNASTTTAAVVNINATTQTNLTLTHNACVSGVSNANCATTARVTIASILTCTISTTDLRLKTGTNPCVDSGTTTFNTTDLLGQARPQGGAYDLGAYERAGTTPPPPGVCNAPATGIYCVAPSGSDSNPGTTMTQAFATILRCVTAMAPGNTCYVADGTYTATGSTHTPISDANAQSGTASQPITLRSLNKHGAKLVFRSDPGAGSSSHRGFMISNRQWWVLDGFDIRDDGGSVQGTTYSLTAIWLEGSTLADITLKNMRIHDVARNVCSTSVFGNTGIFADRGNRVTIEDSTFFTIGRLRGTIGENGCTSTPGGGPIDANDHGIYLDNPTNYTMRRIIFYDITRGWPIHIFTSGGSTNTNVTIVNNTFADKTPTPPGYPHGQILVSSNMVNLVVKNNIGYDNLNELLNCSNVTASSTASVTHNLSSTGLMVSCPTGFAQSSNLTNTDPLFVNAAARDYTLRSNSPAIDSGTAVAGVTCSGTCDRGAIEFGGAAPDTTAPASPTGVFVSKLEVP